MDGEIDSIDRRKLAEKREELGLAADDARQLLKKAALDSAIIPQNEEIVCPHCAKSFNPHIA